MEGRVLRAQASPIEDDGMGGFAPLRDALVDAACAMLLEDTRALDACEITAADYARRRSVHERLLLIALIPEAGDA